MVSEENYTYEQLCNKKRPEYITKHCATSEYKQ